MIEIALVQVARIEVALGTITIRAALYRSIRLRTRAVAVRPTIIAVSVGIGALPRRTGPTLAGVPVHPVLDAFADHLVNLPTELGVGEHFVDDRAHLVVVRRGPTCLWFAAVTLCALRRVSLIPPLPAEHLAPRHRRARLRRETRLPTTRRLGLGRVRLRSASGAGRALVPLHCARRTLRLRVALRLPALKETLFDVLLHPATHFLPQVIRRLTRIRRGGTVALLCGGTPDAPQQAGDTHDDAHVSQLSHAKTSLRDKTRRRNARTQRILPQPCGSAREKPPLRSGDHCIAHYIVPGSLLTNLQVGVDDPTLADLAPSIIAWWGAKRPDGMVGREVFRVPGGVAAR